MPISDVNGDLEEEEENSPKRELDKTIPATSVSVSTMSLEDKFKAAVKVIHSLPKDGPYQPSTGTKLKFYGLFKQATEGPTNVAKPPFWDVVGKYKWEAWKDLGQLSKEAAMIQYIDSLKDIVETMSWDGNVQDFLNSIGPFYEFVNLQGPEMSHVKETIDRITSSSGSSSGSGSGTSSNTSSVVPSPLNSPQKSCNDSSSTGSTTIENEEAEVQLLVEARTATYETHSYARINGGGARKLSGYHSHPFPPPTPQHTYSRKSSIVHPPPSRDECFQEQEESEARNDEVIGATYSNSGGGGVATCQEDLEENEDIPSVIRMGILDNNSLCLSGTEESEKYYSGDSEPETDLDCDDRLQGQGQNQGYSLNQQKSHPQFSQGQGQEIPSPSTNHLPAKSSSFPETSPCSTCASTTPAFVPTSKSNPRGPKPSTSTSPPVGVVVRNRKSSPKQHHGGPGLNGFISPNSPSAGELILSSSVDRLNRDVDHIVARLRILETAYATGMDDGSGAGGVVGRRGRRKPVFGGISPAGIAFLLMWPFAVTFLLKLMGWWWERRKRGILNMARRSLR